MNKIDKISSVNYFCSWIIAGPGPQQPARSLQAGVRGEGGVLPSMGCVLVRPTGWCSGGHPLAARGFGSALIRLQRWRACHLPGGWGRACVGGVRGLGVFMAPCFARPWHGATPSPCVPAMNGNG